MQATVIAAIPRSGRRASTRETGETYVVVLITQRQTAPSGAHAHTGRAPMWERPSRHCGVPHSCQNERSTAVTEGH